MKRAWPKRILIARSAIEDVWEPSWVRALSENGHEVELFDTFASLPGRWGWLQHRLLWGPGISLANEGLLAKARSYRPDVVLMNLSHHYRPGTLRELKKLAFLALYHNDDPFGPRSWHPRYRLVKKSWPLWDGAHFYRDATTADALAAGVKRAATLIDFYLPWAHFPRKGPIENEAVFIGHYEPGIRIDCIEAAAAAGLPLRVYSKEPQWQGKLSPRAEAMAGLFPGLYGEDYGRKLSRAKVAVCFLSKWNRDVYTKRVFEITACGGFLLCERTPFMRSLFEEGREAEYFESPEEFTDKLRYYLSHESARRRVAAAGLKRVHQDGHSVHERMRRWAADVARWRGEAGA